MSKLNRYKDKSILLVEDIESTVQGHRAELEYYGCDITICRNIEQATSVLSSQSFDLLWLDASIDSNFDAGVDLLTNLRKNEYGSLNSGITAIIVSAHIKVIEMEILENFKPFLGAYDKLQQRDVMNAVSKYLDRISL